MTSTSPSQFNIAEVNDAASDIHDINQSTVMIFANGYRKQEFAPLNGNQSTSPSKLIITGVSVPQIQCVDKPNVLPVTNNIGALALLESNDTVDNNIIGMQPVEGTELAQVQNSQQTIVITATDDPTLVACTEALTVVSSSANNPVNNEVIIMCNEPMNKRRKKAQPNLWKRNVVAYKKNSGLSYVTRTGKSVSGRTMKKGCTEKCRINCQKKFDETLRNDIFNQYWNKGDINLQRNFLAIHIRREFARHTQVKSKRLFNVEYVLPNSDGTFERVCKQFFLDTLCISSQMVKTVLSKRVSIETNNLNVNKKCHSRKLPESLRIGVREHIKRFPTIESHYCRKDSNKLYLPQGLSLSQMYKLYQEDCLQKQEPVAKQWLYNDIFNLEFNLGFFQPKKDQCDFCVKYDKSNSVEKEQLKEEFDRHLLRKSSSRDVKDNIKTEAQQNPEISAACFDLQQVLTTPHSMSSQLFYRRKLATYNLTVYDMALKEGFCYMWHEGVGKRGATNIASCIYRFINEKSCLGTKEFKFFSDNCGGQNKNKTIVAMYLHASRTFNVKITHYFLERGHTQNEGDSVHATIERASRNINIYSPQQWYTVVRTAKRQGKPYAVIEMEGRMMDFDILAPYYNISAAKDLEGNKVEWTKVHMLYFNCDQPHSFFFSNEYNQVPCEVRVAKYGKDIKTFETNIPQLSLQSTVTAAKKHDLLWMCQELIIAKDYHTFYENLTVTENESNAEINEAEVSTSTMPQSIPNVSPSQLIASTKRRRLPRNYEVNEGEASTSAALQCTPGVSPSQLIIASNTKRHRFIRKKTN